MEADNRFDDIKGLDELCLYVDKYCEEALIPDCKFDPIVQSILDLTHEDIISLTSEEASAYAFKLHSYCLFLRKSCDKIFPKILWCEEIINRMVAKSWKQFDNWMKYEVRRQAAIEQDTFGTKVERARIYFTSIMAQSKDKIYSVSKMADVMENLAKRKSYERN
jgi:hypothetical protein